MFYFAPGSANFSPSGLKQQDNDLIVLRNPAFAAKFEERFAESLLPAVPMNGGEMERLRQAAKSSLSDQG